MQNHDQCPFCGGKPIKKISYSNQVKKIGIGVNAFDVSGSANVEMKANQKKEEYFLCNGCDQEYIWADIDIDLILKHLKCEKNISKLIKYYYPENITLTELLTKYRTGMVRKHHGRKSWLPNLIIKSQFYICFNYDGKRTFGAFVRKKKERYYYYTMKTIGVPKL